MYVREVETDEYDAFAELVNEGGQLTWTLDASKLARKLGSRGTAFALFSDDDVMVGTLAIKGNLELGYLYVSPEFRNSRGTVMLVNEVINASSRLPYVFMTTRPENRIINRLLEYTRRIDFVGTVTSRFSSSTLNVWVSAPSLRKVELERIIEDIEELYGPIDQ